MAGHSHWAGIKHKKALIDNKRGKIWSKISKALIVAAKLGGGDPTMNPRLRVPLADARAARMPKDNIERAIKKGTGELEGGDVESTVYEGYGPGGVAVMCEILTDNRNRTAPEIRKIFERCGGKLGSTGCVAYLFERKGLIVVPTTHNRRRRTDGTGPGSRGGRHSATAVTSSRSRPIPNNMPTSWKPWKRPTSSPTSRRSRRSPTQPSSSTSTTDARS